jgi:hypothetical protein
LLLLLLILHRFFDDGDFFGGERIKLIDEMVYLPIRRLDLLPETRLLRNAKTFTTTATTEHDGK